MRESAQNPNTAVLAQLITEAFMDQRELRRLCRDSHEFRPVLELVSEASSLRDHVDVLIRFCETRVLFDKLLAAVERVNPSQYACFAPILCHPLPVEDEEPVAPRQSPVSERLAEQSVNATEVASTTTHGALLHSEGSETTTQPFVAATEASGETAQVSLLGRAHAGSFFRDRQAVPDFSFRIKRAQKIDLCALTLTVTLITQKNNISERLAEGADVRILVMDPDPQSLAIPMATARSEPGISEEFYKHRLADTFQEIEKLHKTWTADRADPSGPSNAGSFSVRLLPFAPSFGVFCFDFDLDSEAPGGHVSVSIYSHGEGGNQYVISFGLSSDKDGEWYRYFGSQFEKLWLAGKLWEPEQGQVPSSACSSNNDSYPQPDTGEA